MDPPEKPKRPWWRKKRWSAVLAVWLVVAYPASEGPVRYAEFSGWNPSMAVYRPLDAVERRVPGLWTFRWQWKSYWETLASNQHRRQILRESAGREGHDPSPTSN